MIELAMPFASLSFSIFEFYAAGITVILLLAFLASRLEPKRYYFIRHGKTFHNEQGIKQGEEGSLNPEGVRQAEKLGLYLKHLRIRSVYTSPYPRAVETAERIHATTHARIIKTPLLAERKNPSEVIGKSVHDPAVEEAVALIEQGYHDDTFRFSDEENFSDLKKRAARCQRYLETRPGTRFAVVTHHAFLQIFLSYLLYGKELHSTEYVKMAFFNPSDNGGLTVCDYHPWRRFSPTRGWEIIAYNEPI